MVFLPILGWAQDEVKAPVASEPLLKLTAGDQWVYETKVMAPRNAKMPQGEGVEVKETADGVVSTFSKTRIYEGKKAPKEGSPEFDSFRIERNGKVEEYEYSEVRNDAIYARGWKKEGEEPGSVFLLTKPLLMITASNRPGDQWEVKSGDGKETPLFNRKFRVFGVETVKVPAGEYEAMRIEVSGDSGAVEIKRTYWFAKGVGVVKEEKTYYSQTKRLIHQEMVLTKYTPVK